MEAMLRRKGHRTLNAADAEEAIKVAETRRPNIILTDLDLPTFDSLIQMVRAHKELSNMPVAIIDIDLSDRDDLKVLSNFDQLDELLAAKQ
jgi:DNA-binding response OmpR family regulator